MKMLMGYIKKHKWFMIIGPFFKLLEAFLELFNPILVAKIIDEGVRLGDTSAIVKYGLIILVTNILGFVFSVIGQKCASLTCTRISASMRSDVFKKVSKFSHAELDKYGTASLVNRITNDINQIENAINIFMRIMLRVSFLLVGAFTLSIIINVKMSLIFLVLIPILIVLLVIYTKKTSPYFKKIRAKLDNISKVTKENLSGTRVIRAFNKQADEQARFEDVTADYTKTSINVAKISALLDPVIFLIINASIIALLAVGGWQINIGGMSQGDIIALIDYVTIISISLLLLSQIIAMLVRTTASIHRIDEVLKTEPTIKNADNAHKMNKLEYDALMEFKNVCFNYSLDNKEKSFIKDLSFSIYPHQTIGIIGGTGSGKTTIASLMTRFYDVTSGEILYKGKNIKDFTLEQIRHEISIVQQRSTLFSGTLRDNMKIRNEKATDAEIIEALKISQAWSFVSEWHNDLDYQIMAGGKNVSGGQMQRLTIARALIDNPELLILDDSSSALDFLTDSKLRKALKELNSTLVLISQRATSIKNADLIIVLDNGDVVGMGKHTELMKNCDIYREIYESQSK
ncbi:MAG: ABC transporter ATP-binding protein [Clostridiales bacterium]|nr:ABC transporter ATP-binding protein [Clostridiales bacterium]